MCEERLDGETAVCLAKGHPRTAAGAGVGARQDGCLSMSKVNHHSSEFDIPGTLPLLEALWRRFVVVGCEECGRTHGVAERK